MYVCEGTCVSRNSHLFMYLRASQIHSFENVHVPHACSAPRSQKRASDPLGLSLQIVVSFHVNMLGIKLSFSARKGKSHNVHLSKSKRETFESGPLPSSLLGRGLSCFCHVVYSQGQIHMKLAGQVLSPSIPPLTPCWLH